MHFGASFGASIASLTRGALQHREVVVLESLLFSSDDVEKPQSSTLAAVQVNGKRIPPLSKRALPRAAPAAPRGTTLADNNTSSTQG